MVDDRSFPWHQGQVLPDEAVQGLGLVGAGRVEPHKAIWVVITHDCDLVADVVREPNVEVIGGRRIDTPDGNAMHGKTARRLHLEFHREGAVVPVELCAPDKRRLDKDALASYVPDAAWSLDASNFAVLQYWLASRYRRAAFPDAFEKCLEDTKLKDALARILKPLGDCIRAVYFDVQENGAGVAVGPAYQLGIILVYDAQRVRAEDQARHAKRLVNDAFQKKLDGKELAIEFSYCDAVSDEIWTYKQSRETKQWRLDYLSLREDPQHMPE